MKSHLLLALAGLSLLAGAPALAADNLSSTMNNSAKTPFAYRAKDLGSGVFLPMHLPADETGAPIGSTNGLYVRQGGAWSFGLSGPLPAGTNAIGSVSILNWPVTQAISGTVTANVTFPTTQAVSNAALGAPTDAAWDGVSGSASITAILKGLPRSAGGGAASSVAVTALPALPAGANAIGSVTVSNLPATQPVSGSVSVSNLPATQAVSGTVAVSSLPALPTGTNTLGSVNVLGGNATAVKVDGSAVTQPVSGTVAVTGVATAANQGTANASLASIDGKTPTVGQKTAALSSPVVLPSDQVVNVAVTSGGLNAGTAGTPGSDVLSVQGVAGGKALPVDTIVQGASVDCGGVLTTASTAVALCPAKADARGLVVQNRNAPASAYNPATSVFVNCSTTATGTYHDLEVPAGALYESPSHHAGTGACSFWSQTAGTNVYARRF